MILARRQAHFYAAIALACALPVVFLAGLLLRPAIPTVDESVDELFAIANFPNKTEAIDSAILSAENVRIRAEIINDSESKFLDLQPVDNLQSADVLVYWQAGEAPARDAQTVDSSAVLLGQLSGNRRRRFRLPTEIQGQQGHLLLYSRGQKTLVATFPFTLATQ
ncbi:hypothetical protein C1752_01913 [Acaryochloris thomasi RCC1774]|uniref:DM13 domain-containing protein n=1 Tax=Acaryochloris thomasi RCC1774 TaxID=1764569 RepID=A0A2W1JJL0_9CYAN|nr:hypothetical protein [Acaryochloris thomasi]PZD73608.1 hypothetical protein C1752_01913 [Acaryochloris thomasi RCC1774]